MKPVFVTPHAGRQISESEQWWFLHREKAPLLFEQELEAAFDLIRRVPKAGRLWRESDEPGVRRVLLRKSKYPIYYLEELDHLRLLAVWGAPRGSGPDLGHEPF